MADAMQPIEPPQLPTASRSPLLPLPLSPLLPRTARRHFAWPRTALIGLAICFSACIAMVVLLGEGVKIGAPGLIATMILAFVPLPFYLSLVLWLDRMEKEPPHLLILAVVYGATYAICLGGSINDVVEKIVGLRTAAVISAPLAEEFFKGLFLLGLFLFKRNEFDGIVDGVVYAAMVGLGFAAMENIEYYGQAIHQAAASIHAAGIHAADPNLHARAIASGHLAIAGTFLLRGVFSPFVHPLFTSMTGIAFGIASDARSAAVRWMAPPIGYLLAVILHAIWNGSQTIGGPLFFAAVYFVIFVPTFVGLIVLTRYSMRKEIGIVRDELLGDVASGYLSRADYEMLCSLPARKADLRSARAQGGSRVAKLHRDFQQAATELAFYRFRVANGITELNPEIIANFYRTLRDLQMRMRAAASVE